MAASVTRTATATTPSSTGLATTSATSRTVAPAPVPSVPAFGRIFRRPDAADLRLAIPTMLAVLNGIAFVIVRPGVNDLWAARARASAVSHGVGLTYWFSWFGGGSTPGNYSVLTPYLCAYLGTEVVGALSAVAVTALAAVAVRRTVHPLAAAIVAAFAAAVNLWSGRVPFLLGSAIAVGALIALQHRRRAAAVALTVLSIMASPVSGAFLALGLAGTFLTTRTRAWRPIIAWTIGGVLVAGVGVALAFGAPGPEPFSGLLAAEVLGGLVLLRIARPPDHIRTMLYVSMLAVLPLWAIPNGMGSNFARFVWFCLPVVIVAMSRRRTGVLLLLVAPLLAIGSQTTVDDLESAGRPISTTAFYSSLARELDHIGGLQNYRVEVVDHGSHAGYDALLGHAALARGWETQEDMALNAALNAKKLLPTTYKVWLDNNAVGYVALPTAPRGNYPEYTLVSSGRAPYLHRMWRSPDWQLFRVDNPTPIVGTPATVTKFDQSAMTVDIPCACSVKVRVRWSKFLGAALVPPDATSAHSGSPVPQVLARVHDDGSGWTVVTTPRAGAYELSGSISGIVH